MAALFDVRPEERRPAALAFLALLGITAAHMLIETARDALFLTKVPIGHLPALYLAIAAVGLVTTRAGAWLEGRRSAAAPRFDPVATSLVVGAVITAAFWVGAASAARPILYALYIWSGIFAAWVAGRLWIRLAAIFTVGQAKRLYGVVGTGAVLGAVLGAAAARATLAVVEVRHLLLMGAAILVVTAIGPAALLPRPATEVPDARSRSDAVPANAAAPSLGAQVADVARHPYLVRVLGIVMVTAAVGTAIDFVFKSEVARSIHDPQQLASFLATVSLVTNLLSLVAQSIGVGIVMRVLGVHRALYVMPVLIAFGGGAAVLGLGFAAAIAMRGVDGALRQSLQKTSVELLFVPLPDTMRSRAKPIVDLVGQRGGQAVTSVAILGLVYVVGRYAGPPEATRAVGIVVVLLAVVWLALAHGIRTRYLDVFRSTLQRGRIELSAGMPPLDMSALEALIASLSSRKDAQVLGALDLLAAQSRGRLVPSLILFHPSKAVVLRALELLVEAGRTDFVPVADRLLAHADIEVRTTALRARAAVEHDAVFLRALLDDPEEAIRATALVALVAGGDLDTEDAKQRLDELARGTSEVRRALTRALGEVRVDAARRALLERSLLELAKDDDPLTRALAATSMGHVGAPAFVSVLLDMVDERRGGRPDSVAKNRADYSAPTRAGLPAVEALAEMGDVAVVEVDAALDLPGVADETKWRLLRVLARSRSSDAVPRLARRLGEDTDPTTRTRILRALRAAQTAGVRVPAPANLLRELATDAIASIAQAIAFRLAHERLFAESARPRTPAADLLQKLLRDNEIEATDRLFLVLGLLHPAERFTRIQRGLASKNVKAHASSRELLENVVRAPLRDRVLAVFDDVSDRDRLVRIGSERTETSYGALLGAMIDRGGELGVLAAYHASELGLRDTVAESARRLDARKTAFGDLSTPDASAVLDEAEVGA